MLNYQEAPSDFSRFKQHDIPIMSVDTDGNADLITPVMMEWEVNFLFPMEVAVGCDVNVWRAKYPTLGMMRVLALGPNESETGAEGISP